MSHPMLTFWRFSAFGGLGTSRVDLETLSTEKCPACGREKDEETFVGARIHIAGPGSRWPDVLNCDLPIFHEKLVHCLMAEGLTGYVAHETEIVAIDNKRLAASTPPRYYLIEIIGRVDIDESQFDDFGGGVCPICFIRRAQPGPYQWAPKRTVPRLETWDGSDFVKTRNWFTGLEYCSRRFVDLASKNHWGNFRFGTRDTMPGVGMWGDADKDGGSRTTTLTGTRRSRSGCERGIRIFLSRSHLTVAINAAFYQTEIPMA